MLWFSAASVARTLNTRSPGVRPEYVTPELHSAKGVLSSEHSKAAGSSAVKVNVAVVLDVEDGGPEIVTTGAVVSGAIWIVHACVVEPVLPAASVASTREVCGPSARPVRSTG